MPADEKRNLGGSRPLDLWQITKHHGKTIVVVGGFFVALVTLYNMVLYHNEVINPKTVAKFKAEKATETAAITAREKLAAQRYCMTTAMLTNGGDKEQKRAILGCLKN